MREIKFRAWDRNINAMGMVYGFDFSIEEVSIMFPKLTKIDGKINKDSVGTQAFIDKVELMQFTGLKDKNKKEIYEGDIILEDCIVIWKNDGWGIESGKHNLSFYSQRNDFEVIGNKFENPELLK